VSTQKWVGLVPGAVKVTVPAATVVVPPSTPKASHTGAAETAGDTITPHAILVAATRLLIFETVFNLKSSNTLKNLPVIFQAISKPLIYFNGLQCLKAGDVKLFDKRTKIVRATDF
jgi:hypothetical protein